MPSLSFYRVTLLAATLLVPGTLLAAMEQGRVSYGGLDDKGLSADTVLERSKPFEPLRPVPVVRFPVQGAAPERKGAVGRRAVEVTLLERAGETREGAEVAFGFPLAQGALFDAEKLRVVDVASGEELPTQVHLLAHWPDQSLKSLLLQFRADLAGRGSRKIAVEFGDAVSRKARAAGTLRVDQERGAIRVTTGPLEVVVDTERFVPFAKVDALEPERRRVAASSGIELEDENGVLHSSAFGAPESVRIERAGTHDAVIRIGGPFSTKGHGSLMRYVARLRFLAGSSRVDLSITLINSETDLEFTDIRRLGIDLVFPGADSWKATAGAGERVIESEGPLKLLQADERSLEEGATSAPGQMAGWLAIRSGAERVQIAVRDF